MPDRLRAIETGRHVFFDLLLEVEAQLMIDFVFDGVAVEESAKAIEKISQHDRSSCT